MNELEYKRIYNEAHEAGMKAGRETQVIPATFTQLADPFDRNSAVLQEWHEPDGVCGFAWINVPGNSPFGKWAKSTGLAHKGYPKGLNISCTEFGQSMQRKEAYAWIFAKVLNAHGIKAHAVSRID